LSNTLISRKNKNRLGSSVDSLSIAQALPFLFADRIRASGAGCTLSLMSAAANSRLVFDVLESVGVTLKRKGTGGDGLDLGKTLPNI